jgi:hypothetical protein
MNKKIYTCGSLRLIRKLLFFLFQNKLQTDIIIDLENKLSFIRNCVISSQETKKMKAVNRIIKRQKMVDETEKI